MNNLEKAELTASARHTERIQNQEYEFTIPNSRTLLAKAKRRKRRRAQATKKRKMFSEIRYFIKVKNNGVVIIYNDIDIIVW